MTDVSRSVCCGASLRHHNGEEGTQWYTCSACKRPADSVPDLMAALEESLRPPVPPLARSDQDTPRGQAPNFGSES